MSDQAASPTRQRVLLIRMLAVAVALVVIAAAATSIFIVTRQHQRAALAGLRPSGIPASVSTGLASLMGLSPVPARPAPGFRLTDQDGRSMSLSRFRGKVVVLEFMDSHCRDICPIVSQEFIDAYHDLGRAAGGVVFAAVNVNASHARVLDVRAFSAEHQLTTVPGWHFFTGPPAALRAVWGSYGIQVQAPGPDADIVHTSVVYFIAPDGTERYAAAPMDDHANDGTAYLAPGQLADWGQGIALVARNLAG